MRRLITAILMVIVLLFTIRLCTASGQSPEFVGELKVVVTYDPDEDGLYENVGSGYYINLYDYHTNKFIDSQPTDINGSHTFGLLYDKYLVTSGLGYADLTHLWSCRDSELLDQDSKTLYLRCEKQPVWELLFPFLSNLG